MGRYIKDVELNQPIDVVSMVMEDYIYHNRFSRTDWNGEMVFYLEDKHGKERYLKWSYAGGSFHIEAWLKGPMGKEMDLNGTGGGASRKEYRQSMDELIGTLKSQSAEGMAGGHIGSDPLHHSEDYGSDHVKWSSDTDWQQSKTPIQTERAAVGRNTDAGATGSEEHRDTGSSWNKAGSGANYAGLILGVIAVVFGAQMPLVGLIFGIWGLQKAKRGYAGNSRAMKILCVMAIVEAAIVTLGVLVARIQGSIFSLFF